MAWINDWTTRAACRVSDPDTLFVQGAAQNRAKAVCVGCPIRFECLEGAIERREPWGVWGGELFLQGVVIARKRPRGRPRKIEAAA